MDLPEIQINFNSFKDNAKPGNYLVFIRERDKVRAQWTLDKKTEGYRAGYMKANGVPDFYGTPENVDQWIHATTPDEDHMFHWKGNTDKFASLLVEFLPDDVVLQLALDIASRFCNRDGRQAVLVYREVVDTPITVEKK